jgi:hypothetical protein
VIPGPDADPDLLAFLAQMDDYAEAVAPPRCEHCGEPMTVGRSDKRYCSTTCRVYAWQARQAEALGTTGNHHRPGPARTHSDVAVRAGSVDD